MTTFNGFPEQLPDFFRQLAKNNNKEWFQENKTTYEKYVKMPSQEFVSVIGERLRTLYPSINAIPKINKSLFRINRDTRFSHDKSPYKTNLGILFWDGPVKRMETSGFYFHIQDNTLMLGCGRHVLSKNALLKFRQAVVNKTEAKKLVPVIDLLKDQGYSIGTRHYKRIPRGFDASDDFEKEYLLYNGLTARIEMKIPKEVFTPSIVDLVFGHFKKMSLLHHWLMAYV